MRLYKTLIGITALLSILALSGCLSTDNLKPAKLDTSYYRLDANSRMLCRGESNNCQDLTLIASSMPLLSQIETLYGQPLKGSSNVRSLMLLMLQPVDKAYTAEPLSGLNYQYRLPITARTQTVWQLLEQAYKDQYGSSNAQ
ncbi:MAG: hypothetical protein OIF57_03505 [Marinobacterium sp.]|nr:hypothetical protein [Marinobacterium sp.]